MSRKWFRFLVEYKDGNWQAFCIDLGLAVQGESSDEVKRKIQEQANLYMQTALSEDRRYLQALLKRKSPLAVIFRYYLTRFAPGFIRSIHSFNFKRAL